LCDEPANGLEIADKIGYGFQVNLIRSNRLPMPQFRTVDPATLLLSTQRQSGADPVRLHTQIRLFGGSLVGMPPIDVEEDSIGQLRIVNGTTRAVRIAKLSPGQFVVVEIVDSIKRPFRTTITVSDVI
jgi:hypothetical protein